MSSKEDVERLKRKMAATNKPAATQKKADDLPSMEASGKTNAENQAEVEKLKQKAEDGAVGVVTKVIEQPKVQQVLKKSINKQTFVSGLFMAFLLIGFLEVSTAIKELINYSWQFDLIAGIVLITIGAIYMYKEIFTQEGGEAAK